MAQKFDTWGGVPAPKDNPRGDLPDDPDSLRREMLAMLLAFNRFTAGQLAEALGVSEDELARLREAPDVIELIRDLRCLMPRPGDVNELLMSDAERNIRWLRRVREGKFDHVEAKLLRVREDAAKALLDRQVPKKLAVVSAERDTYIDVTPGQVDRMKRLLAPIAAAENDDDAGQEG